MGRKSKTQQLTDGILGQHLALSVAAHLARTQLVPDPLQPYDAQHMSETLDVVANALARVAPLYVQDAKGGTPRQLMEAELEGARVKRGASIVALKDGRSLSAVSIKRADLRQAIAILKAIGIQELQPRPPPRAAAEPGADPLDEMRKCVADIDKLVRGPLVAAELDRANHLIVSIARAAPQGRIANLAMQLMSALHEARGADRMPDSVLLVLARLRAALEDTEKTRS